jgi:hypothetical protein
VIAEIPLWKKNSWKGLHDSQSSIMKRKNLWKGLRDSWDSIEKEKNRVRGFLIARILLWKRKSLWKRLPESLNPIVKGIPNDRDSHWKGSRQQWVVASVSIMITNGDCSQVNVCVGCLKISSHKFMKVFHEECAPLKGQGACVKIRRKSWLKQLRAAISSKASVPKRVKSTKFTNKFCRLAS